MKGCDGIFPDGSVAQKFRLPNKERHEYDYNQWVRMIPRDPEEITENTRVCESHWPKGYATVKIHGKSRPENPPTVFSGINASKLPTPPPPKRTTKRALTSERSILEDQLAEFLESDKIPSFASLCEKIREKKNEFQVACPVTMYSIGHETMIVQSEELRGGTPLFLLKIHHDLSFNAYHCGVNCTISSLSKNRICVMDMWSKVFEAIRFLNTKEISHKTQILLEQMKCMGTIHVGEKKYSPETIARSFEYFATSRSLFTRIRLDYELPCETTLTTLTTKVSSMEDNEWLNQIFSKLDEKDKSCILLLDEVYVKPSLTYQGGTIFGKAVNHPDLLATTILSFMVCPLFGGPKFLYKVYPVVKLDTDFLYTETMNILNDMKSVGVDIKAIVADNNRVNQSFFKRFPCAKNPWLSDDNYFLLFDFVHLIKSIRNNWITEKTQELQFTYEGKTYLAKWSDIKKLYELEQNSLVKLSKLTDVAVSPKPIERQKVETCLRVFCDETISAMETHTGMSGAGAEGTILFLKLVTKFWKIMNVRSKNEHIFKRDDDKAPIGYEDSASLKFLEVFGNMAENMKAGKKRIKQLSKDTARAVHQTCKGMIDLSIHLLKTTHEYVLLGKITSDPLEKMFCKLRQGSGGTYFITVQNVLQKVRIQKAKLCLDVGVDIDSLALNEGHSCGSCGYLMDETASDVFNNLSDLESRLSDDTLNALVYIAGYVSRNDKDDVDSDDTSFYVSKYGAYISCLNRGGLTLPKDEICQWVIYCYIMYLTVSGSVCRTSLCNIMMLVAQFNKFNVQKHHGRILSNILINNHCHLFNPRSSKETNQKVLKLSK